ncbi:MAG TPA: hypothetical protein VKZ95_08735 [Sphingobacteriaceae bacterium]|nr:hypothetical protein [Sphingobacteriaceae bacterium]
MEKDVKIETYGIVNNVRFLSPLSAKLVDAEGNEIMCCCANPAAESIIGKDAFTFRCQKFMYGSNE